MIKLIMIRESIQKYSHGEQERTPPEDMLQQVSPRFSTSHAGGEGKRHSYADNEQEKRKDQICRSPAVPICVLKGPIRCGTITGVIDKDHQGDRRSTKQIERQ